MLEMAKVIQLLGKLTSYLGLFYVGGNESISLVPTMRCKIDPLLHAYFLFCFVLYLHFCLGKE